MTANVLAAEADDRVLDIAKLMIERDYNGLPIVDEHHTLLGMVTMKDLIDSDGIYMPTAIKFVAALHTIHGEDIPSVDKKLKALKNLKATAVMNRDPKYLVATAGLEQAAEAFLLHHEDVMPVLDSSRRLLGIVTKYDVLKSLVNPLDTADLRNRYTVQHPDIIQDIKKEFVVVSRTRARFWYLGSLVFLILGIVVAMAFILRITIRR